jgi:excisionase family DNA binding protein
MQTTPTKYPYLAVICGEEHAVKGWREGNLLTDKGEFAFNLLHGDLSIQSARLVEVALLQFDQNGEWLLNGHNLRMLEFLPAGNRLSGIINREDLRVHKREIHAVAWFQGKIAEDIIPLLDTILDSWKTVEQPNKIKEMFSPSQQFGIGLGNVVSSFTMFKDLGKPIWLTKFQPVAATNQNIARLEIASTDSASVPAKVVKPIKQKAIKLRQSKPTARAKKVLVPIKSVPEFFTSIQGAADYIGVTARTILNWKSRGWLEVEQNGRKIRIAKTDLDKCKNQQ